MYGYIPDAFVPEDAAAFDAMTEKYNPSAQPTVVSWESFAPFAKEQAEQTDAIRSAGWSVLWWHIARFNRIPIWDSNQGQLGSCAGWSAANGYMTTVLYQLMLGAFRFELINPLAMWLRTKNGSMRGGQSMSKVLMGGNQFGNYPVSLVGEYSTKRSNDTLIKIDQAAGEAQKYQIGACRLQGDLVERIVLCLRAGLVVCIGNSVAVSGSTIDENDMRIALLGGSWSHATLLDGYAEVNGKTYIHWTNSHGNRYRSQDRFYTPESGCWMTLVTLKKFCAGKYTDAFCIYRAEAPVDTLRKTFTPATFSLLSANS